MMRPLHCSVCTIMALAFSLAAAGDPHGQQPVVEDAEYVRVTNDRAQKIVVRLDLKDSEKELRCRDLIAKFYRDLHAIHADRDAKLKSMEPANSSSTELLGQSTALVRSQYESDRLRLHYAFVASLSTELSGDEVDQIKNGLTYDVVPKTYQQYLKLYPSLTLEQQRMVRSLLLEAREHAMDAGSSDAKHSVFGKYKGRINNYLSAQGFDAKQAERDLKAREEKK